MEMSKRYILKTPLWKHVDTLFLLYSWKEQHEVEERKMEKLGPMTANTFVAYRNFQEIENFVVPCYRKGLRNLPFEPTFFSVSLVNMMQTCLMPLEMINHRGLHLSLLLLQRFIMLIDKDLVVTPIPERTFRLKTQEAGNVFSVAKCWERETAHKNHDILPNGICAASSGTSDSTNSNKDDARFSAEERAAFLKKTSIIEACNTTMILDCCEIAPNSLAKGMQHRDGQFHFSVLSLFDIILRESSCKQHVHVVNQNLVMLQTYGLYAPSERKRREQAVAEFRAKQQHAMETLLSSGDKNSCQVERSIDVWQDTVL